MDPVAREGAPAKPAPVRSVVRAVASVLGFAFAVAVGLVGEAVPGRAAPPSPVRAVATTGMVGDVVATVGGECVETTVLMGPGVDPHLYQARASDVRAFRTAEVIFYSGYALEGQLGSVLERLARTVPTHAVAQAAVSRDHLIETQDAYGVDPHLWMDVSLWARTVPVVVQALGAVRPDCAAMLEAAGKHYGDRLSALHAWVTEAVATIPEDQRLLVTAHDAFNYFGRAYGIEVVGIQGISTESEAGIADIRVMAQDIAARRVPAVFIESTINPRTVQAVIDAAREKGHGVSLGGELYSDALGEAGSSAGTYIGMIVENTTAIVTALGGHLPPLPDAVVK